MPAEIPPAPYTSPVQPPDPLAGLLSVDEFADCLQLSRYSVLNYIRAGKIDAYRVAGKRRILIRRTEIDRLLEPITAKQKATT